MRDEKVGVDGRLIEIPVGHHVHQTAPAKYNAAVEAFLADLAEPAPDPMR